MNYDLALIGAILESGSIAEAVKLGLRQKFLASVEAQAYWDILSDHHARFQEVPSLEHFMELCPSYTHNPVEDSLEAILYELKTRYLYSEVESIVGRIADLNNADPWEARQKLSALADALTVEVQETNTDLVAGSDKPEVQKRIAYLRQNGGLLGYAWPWEYLNRQSKGVCPGNFIYFYGREKSKKTFLMCFLADHFERMGLRVLFCTREMTMDEIAWRLYPMRSGLPYQELTAGATSSDGLIKLEDAMDDLYARKNLIVTEVEGGMAGLRAKIEEVKPSIVIHDYLMAVAEDEMEDKKITNEAQVIGRIAGDFKRLAMRLKIPIIAVGHANREGVKLRGKSSTEYAGSDKIVRRVDYGFRVIADDAGSRMALILNAGRETRKFVSFTLDGTLCNGFGDFVDADVSWIDELDAVQENTAERKKKREDDPDKAPPAGKPLNKTVFRRR